MRAVVGRIDTGVDIDSGGVRRVDVVFERRGRGQPLVLVHGMGGRWQIWRPILDRLADHRDVVAVDLPGFGQSPPLPAGMRYDIDTTTGALAGFFEKLNLGAPHVAGNSLGGLLALELAARGLARSATALAPAGFFSRAQLLHAVAAVSAIRWGAKLPPRALRRIARSPRARALFFGLLYGRPDRLDADAVVADAQALNRATAFTATLLARTGAAFRGRVTTAPVTVAWGTRDRMLPPSQAARARRRLPGARFVWLDGCGHMAMNDDPDLVTRVILDGSATPRPDTPAVP